LIGGLPLALDPSAMDAKHATYQPPDAEKREEDPVNMFQ
jgi:hypothetical protein